MTHPSSHRYPRLRGFGRRAVRNVKHWARDPEIRQAAEDLAVLGLAAVAVKKAPLLHPHALAAWRKVAPKGTVGRKALMHWAVGNNRTKRFARVLEGPLLRAQRKTVRLVKRAHRAGISRSVLEERLAKQRGWRIVGGKVVYPG